MLAKSGREERNEARTGPSPSDPSATDTSHRRFQELASAEHTLIAARWAGVVFGFVQVQMHATYGQMPYPTGVRMVGFAITAAILLANIVAFFLLRRVVTVRAITWLTSATLAIDVLVVSGFVWLYTFDEGSVHFLLFFLLPAEAALKFRLAGVLWLSVAVATIYTARQAWASAVYGFGFSLPSISYRMGILVIVALIIGMFARRLCQRTDDLLDALGRVEQEERWRSNLIDMLAHDFRSPVGSATSSILLVQSKLESLEQEDTRRLLEAAVRQNRRGLALADDILALTRSKQGRLRLNRRQVDLPALLRRVAESLDQDQGWLTIDAPPNLQASVDPDRLEQVVANLLSNARKHGRPPVTLRARQLGDAGLEVRVSDRGEGVPDEYRDSLFAQFGTGPRRDSVGLGLWLVDVIAQAHGGGAEYTTVEGHPTFIVTMPGVVAEAER